MVTETGRVIGIEDDALWVETIKRSTCSSCVARKGCGQSLLNQMGAKTGHLRVPLGKLSSTHFRINDEVTLGIPNDVIVKSALLLYLLPLVLMLVLSGIAHTYGFSELLVLLAGIFGLAAGGLLVRYHTFRYRNDPRYQPFLVSSSFARSGSGNSGPDSEASFS